MTNEEWKKELTLEGYKKITMCPLTEPNTDFGVHTHDESTVHVILEGELILKDNNGEKVLKQGEKIEIPKGTTHSAKIGNNGCKFLVGIKQDY